MLKNRIFELHPSCSIDEFAGILYPNRVTTLLFKNNKINTNPYKTKTNHVKKILIPKLGRGKFGNPTIPNFIDYFFYTATSIILLPYILKYDKIIFHAPPFFDTLIIPILKLFKKKIYIVAIDAESQFSRVHNKRMTFVKKVYYRLARRLELNAVKNSTAAFGTSFFIFNDYKKYNKNTFHIPNGADVKAIFKIKPKRMFKEFTITYLGGFEMWRGIDMLIDAFKIIKKQNKKVKLLLIGGGPDFEKIKEYAKSDKDIVFTGYLDHDKAIAYCKGSDILVMPSRNVLPSHTISSIKCFEYIACEVPNIVTDSGEHAHWVKKFGAGLIVKDNVESIKSGILKLMQDKDLYNQIKENCKKNKWEVDYKKFKKTFVDEVLKD